jgi:DNA-directed RNA polymerase specialized sigma24 family protein
MCSVLVDLPHRLSNLSPVVTRLLDRPHVRKQPEDRIVRDLQRQIRLNASQVAELCRRYQAGESVPSLKQAFTINRETVLLHLKRAGVTRPPNFRKLGDDEVQSAATVYADGLSLRRTAEKFGVSERTMRRELAEAGYVIRTRNGW